jgi:hypothetical protein
MSLPGISVNDIQSFIQSRTAANEVRTFQGLAPIYPFTTENLAGYLPLLNLKNKSVLTVSGSGDQVLNAVYFGAGKIDAFDINLLSSVYTEIKMQAVMTLSYQEFLDFFSLRPDNRLVLSLRLYEKSATKLSPLARITFKTFYAAFNGDGCSLRDSPLFYNKPPVDPQATVYNAYLQDTEKYRQTRAALDNVEYRWFQCDISGLCLRLEPKAQYDIILLSNIADYIHRMYPGEDHLEQFTRLVLQPLTGHLSPGGLLCAACLFQVDSQTAGPPKNDMYRPQKRRGILKLPGMEYREIIFPGAISGCQDALVILKNTA